MAISQRGIILLAGGSSSRLGEAKQLLEFNGINLLQHAVENAIASIADEVILITGAYHDSLLPYIDPSVTVLRNTAWMEGMSSSIRMGINMLKRDFPGISSVLIMLSDQPLVNYRHLNSLFLLLDDQTYIAASRYAGVTAVPAAFTKHWFGALENLTGDTGARSLFKRMDSDIAFIDLPEALLDIDTREDYRVLLSGRQNLKSDHLP